MRPIDADYARAKLISAGRAIKGAADSKRFTKLIGILVDRIDAAPTLDYAPARRGEFERQEEEYLVGLHVTPVLCKTCNTTYFTMNKEGKRTTCCPYCGALLPEPPKEEA